MVRVRALGLAAGTWPGPGTFLESRQGCCHKNNSLRLQKYRQHGEEKRWKFLQQLQPAWA